MKKRQTIEISVNKNGKIDKKNLANIFFKLKMI